MEVKRDRNIKMVIEYDGTDFCGWQYQPNERTVQGEVEHALKQLTSQNIRIIGAGRTDQGVHAFGQVANFHTSSSLELAKIRKALNSLTGNDIYVKQIFKVNDDFHSRYSAQYKIYEYDIVHQPSPFKLRYNWYVRYPLDLFKMGKAKDYLVGQRNFRYFSAENDRDNTFCILHSISLTEQNSRIIMQIKGDRFLRKMVRGIVGFLHDVGRGHYKTEQTQDVLDGKISDLYFAPPQGLFLVEVKY